MTALLRGGLRPLLLAVLLVSCEGHRSGCADCGTVVFVAVGEPSNLLPPLVYETVGRDIGDQIYERLAYLAPGASPIDSRAYRPGLARSWEQIDSLAWRFHLRPDARWQDGRRVTAEDVVFSFDAFSDSTLEANALGYLAGRLHAAAEDSTTVRITFAEQSPEQLYDATYHVRILPRHIWDTIPRARWAADTTLGHLIGSGPYRIQNWQRGSFLTLVADTLRAATRDAPAVRRAIWRFASDPDAALNLLLSHEADVMETVGSEARVRRVERDTSFRLVSYPAAGYGFLAFRLADAAGRSHPVLADKELRRALAQAVDRPTLARAIFGPATKAPPGPMSQLLWIWDDATKVVGFDSAQARETVAKLKAHRPLASIDILVPSTSATRRQLAVAIQEAWRRAGVTATVTAVDFPVFQERLAKGRFDTYIGAYLDEPSPRGLADGWTRAGWAAVNYGHYANPVFDSLLQLASREENVANAKRRWREAMDTLNADVPAIFLYSLANVAALHRRLKHVELDPYSWASGLPSWEVDESRRRDTAITFRAPQPSVPQQ
jgi:peptide/nickel transport system substrate-binding protein